jgi:hypothetical protein
MAPSVRLLLPPILVSVTSSAVLTAYAAYNVPPSLLGQLIHSYGLAFFLLLWAVQDAWHRRRVPCYDFGFLLCFGFPLTVVWYIFWSRGLRGFAVLGILAAIYFAPSMCYFFAWIAFTIARTAGR